MTEKTNREKILNEEEYFPDQELADLAYVNAAKAWYSSIQNHHRIGKGKHFCSIFLCSVDKHVVKRFY